VTGGSSDSIATITTTRLLLHCPVVDDADAVAALMSPEISQWLASWPPEVDTVYAARRIVEAQDAINNGQALHWLVRSRASSQMMGWIRVTRSEPDRTRGELGFWLGKTFHGAGYATEATRAVLPIAFERLALATIEGGAQLSNDGSVRVMRHVGMMPIGERQVWAEVRQRFERCVYYAIDRAALAGGA
jgi:[ribosomal protein S5]-alanine N-acetyltransferase